jgi:hypothetical protein
MHTKQKQFAVIELLFLEGWPGDEIPIRLHNLYEEAACSRATVFRWISTIRSGNSELQSDKSPGRQPRCETDWNIRSILRDNPFASLRMIAEMLGIPPETVRFHLLRIGYVLKALHWVPHIPTDDLKLIRVEMCQTMLAALRAQEHNHWYNIVTGESWFCFEYVRDRLWISSLDSTRIVRLGQLRRRNICWQCPGILTDSRSWQFSRKGHRSTRLGS